MADMAGNPRYTLDAADFGREKTTPRYDSDEIDKLKGKQAHLDLLKIFPDAFTFFSVLVFAAPMVKGIYLAIDPLVTYWFGDAPKCLLIFPPVFISAGYAIHWQTRTPSMRAIIMSLIGSSFVLGGLGNAMAMKSLELGNKFAARDCKSFDQKYDLEREWLLAHDFHANCEGKSGTASEYAVHTCAGYSVEAFKHPIWEFLWSMESQYRCAGWCDVHQPIWTFTKPTDSCSTVVAQVMLAKVKRESIQLAVYNILVFTITAAFLIALGPTLRKRGVGW